MATYKKPAPKKEAAEIPRIAPKDVQPITAAEIEMFNKKYGTLSDPDFMATGSVILDSVLGGGIPEGHFVEISSPHGLGKSTACFHICATQCALGKKVLILDFEKGSNKNMFKSMNLLKYHNKNLFVHTPTTFNDCEDILTHYLLRGINLIIIDSLSAIIEDKILDQKSYASNVQVGATSRVHSAFLPKLRHYATLFKVPFIFVNQMRAKINTTGGQSTQEAAGGNAAKHYMDIRLQMKEAEYITRKESTSDTGNDCRIGVHAKLWSTKNRFARPYIEKIITIMFGLGISDSSAYLRFLANHYPNVITKGAAGYYTINWPGQDPIKVQGNQKLIEWAQSNLPLLKEFVEKNGGIRLVPAVDEEGEEGDSGVIASEDIQDFVGDEVEKGLEEARQKLDGSADMAYESEESTEGSDEGEVKAPGKRGRKKKE